VNGFRQAWYVAVREMGERLRSPVYYLSLGLMVLVVGSAIVLPSFIDGGPTSRDVGITGVVPAGLGDAIESRGDAVDIKVKITTFDSQAAGERAVRAGDVDVLLVDATRLEWQKRVESELQTIVSSAIQLVTLQQRAAAAGISADQLAALAAPVAVDNVELGRVQGRTEDDETAAYLISLVLFFSVSSYGGMVLSGVVEEKSSRVVEVLLARIPARSLLAGKIAGIGLLGLAQVVVTGVVALAAIALTDVADIPAARASVIAWAVVWFVLGYALIATAFGALGSLASRPEDASSLTMPLIVVLVAGYFVSMAAIGSPGTWWARLASWFPVTAPFAMPNRIAMGATTWWDPLLAVLLALLAIAGLVALGGRIYSRAVLHTGGVVRLVDAWRGSAAGASVGATTATATVHRWEQAVPGVAAAVTGGVTIALSRDVVIGIAVAAMTYAVASRTARARRDAGHRAG
jgi:ABC-2 type transport system permease protein